MPVSFDGKWKASPPPDADEMWFLQEDLAIQRELLQIIRDTNDTIATFRKVPGAAKPDKSKGEIDHQIFTLFQLNAARPVAGVAAEDRIVAQNEVLILVRVAVGFLLPGFVQDDGPARHQRAASGVRSTHGDDRVCAAAGCGHAHQLVPQIVGDRTTEQGGTRSARDHNLASIGTPHRIHVFARFIREPLGLASVRRNSPHMAEIHVRHGALAEAREIYLRTAEIYIGQGFLPKAVMVYKTVLKLTPGLPQVRPRKEAREGRVGCLAKNSHNPKMVFGSALTTGESLITTVALRFPQRHC